MKKIFFVLILATVATFTYSFTNFAATPINAEIPISFTTNFNNPCTGEVVTLNYEGQLSIRGVINGNRVNISEHVNIDLSGVGQTSGATYVGHISENISQNGSLNNGQFVFNAVINANLNVSGGGNNVKETLTLHITVNANGDVTVIRGDASAVCQ